MWVRKEEFEALDGDLLNRVRLWTVEEWPFETLRYPGREV